MQGSVIAGQFREIGDIVSRDRTGGTQPPLTDLQVFEVKRLSQCVVPAV